MKHIKLFEEFEYKKEKYPKKSFGKFTAPEEPIKRKLTDEETKFMFKFFPYHSWSDPDANGYIILGGGEHVMGKYYITEEDLANFMAEEVEEAESTDK